MSAARWAWIIVWSLTVAAGLWFCHMGFQWRSWQAVWGGAFGACFAASMVAIAYLEHVDQKGDGVD